MTTNEPVRDGDANARPRLGMLRETYDLALEIAGPVWPTPGMALGSLLERGVAFLRAGAELPPLGREGVGPLDALDRTRQELLVTEAQFTFTRYVTFVLTREGEALEATWLTLADEHLAIHAEIVASRREEERLKRELAAVGVSTVPLPEHDVPPDIPTLPDRRRKSRGMYADLFEGASALDAPLEVAPTTLEAAGHLTEAQGWAAEWGEDARLVVFAHGLALALREREGDVVDPTDATSVRAAYEQARGRLMGLEGRYTTLRFRLFELRHNNRVLGWRITALRIEARGMRNRLELFREDRARLEEELARRRATTGDRHDVSAGASAPTGWRTRLSRLFSGPPSRDTGT